MSSDIRERILVATTASCTCMTATPVTSYHDAFCKYRVLMDALERIETLEQKMRSLPSFEPPPKNNEPIMGFFGNYRWLSNFYPVTIPYRGIIYPSVENAYQAAKFDNDAFKVMLSNVSAVRAKTMAKQWRTTSDWNERRLDVMKELIKIKFSPNDNLPLWKNLDATDWAYIEETNTWNDKFWGVCNGEGENHLGRIIMQVRRENRNV